MAIEGFKVEAPGIFSFPALTDEFCELLLQERNGEGGREGGRERKCKRQRHRHRPLDTVELEGSTALSQEWTSIKSSEQHEQLWFGVE